MPRTLFAVATILLCTVMSASLSAGDRIWFGGGVGAGFGDVDYIDVSPIVGYSVSDRLSLGVGLTYRYRDDDRYPSSLSTTDYGGNVFARFDLGRSIFVHGEYEYLSYEYVRFDLTKDREGFSSVLAGPGWVRPLGRRVSLFALALFNFSYDDDELDSPYDEEWIYRVGVTAGF